MDGSGAVAHLIRNVVADLVTVDYSSRLLFWTASWSNPFLTRGWRFWGIYFSDMHGQNVKVAFLGEGQGLDAILVSGNRLFWANKYDKTLSSCDKETGNNFVRHEMRDWDWKTEHLGIDSPTSAIPEGKYPCSKGALCSHICVSTTSGYMRCLCPDGHQLLPDGWTCDDGEKPIPTAPTQVFDVN